MFIRMYRLNLSKVTYTNDYLDEQEIELLLDSNDNSTLMGFGIKYAVKLGFSDCSWEPDGIPTMGNDRLPKVLKQKLPLSNKTFLIIR